MTLTYESIQMPNIEYYNTIQTKSRSEKRNKTKRKAETEGDSSLLGSKKKKVVLFEEKQDETEGDNSLLGSTKKKFQRRNKSKRKGETGDGSVTENKKTKRVILRDGASKTLNAAEFHKKLEVAKSDRTKEKEKLYKKKNKKKQQQPPVDEGKILRECTEYLNKWKNDKPNWKFEKIKQIKLVNNMFYPGKVSDEIFPVFVEYIAGSSGHMRKLVSTRAMEVVEEMERWCEMPEQEKSESSQKPDETKYNRAREILQALDE